MSKISQIEAELDTIDQGKFQKLCNHYLFQKYDASPTESGGATGQDKTKPGTPDSFMVLPNSNFIFVEQSTQKGELLPKFKDDLENKCFNEKKTEIPISKIELVILCYNSKLSTGDSNKLAEVCKSNDTEIVFLDLNRLTHEIFDYPRLAKGLLNVETDTEQILKPSDFIVEIEHQGTTQKNQFIGRRKEQEELANSLKIQDLIIVSGKAGLGKTRLITEVMTNFKKENSEYEIFCIKSNNQAIYNDLRAYFKPSKKYIVLVDDANRVGELSNILHLTRNVKFEAKVIVTVRDYAIGKVKSVLKEENYEYKDFVLKPLNYDEIRHILYSLNITGNLCVDKIIKIAAGNPRLVLMAANSILDDDNCNRLNNKTDIYDSFFSHFFTKEEFKNKKFLSVLGIICFLRSFGKKNTEFNQNIYSIFNIAEEFFWEQVQKLHRLELVDMHENRIVKIADQVLANYFFKYVFFDKKIVPFYKILEHYFEEYPGKIRESILPIIQDFDSEKILSIIGNDLKKYQKSIETNEERLIIFYGTFGIYLPEDTLIFISETIRKIPLPETSDFVFRHKDEVPNRGWELERKHPLFKLLKEFSSDTDEHFETCLEILFDYVFRQPNLLPEIVNHFTNGLSFKYDKPNLYNAQLRILKFIYLVLDNDTEHKDFYTNLLLEVSGTFLHTAPLRKQEELEYHESVTGIYRLLTNEAKELRKELILRLLTFWELGYKKEFYSFLSRYRETVFAKQLKLGYTFDMHFFAPFMQSKFFPSDFRHCMLVHDYFSTLKHLNVEVEEFSTVKVTFESRQFLLYKELTFEIRQWYKLSGDNNGVKKFNIFNRKRFRKLFRRYTLEDYFQLIDDITIFQKVPRRQHYLLLPNLEIILGNLLEKSQSDCIEVVKYILANNNTINFIPRELLHSLIRIVSREDIFKIIGKYEYKNKFYWILHFYENLTEDNISFSDVIGLLSLIEDSDKDFNLRLEFLKKYKKTESKIFQKVIDALLNRYYLTGVGFDLHTEYFFDNCMSEFDDNFPLIKKLYLYFYLTNKFISDRKGKYFRVIYQKDNGFLRELIDAICKGKHYISKEDVDIDFSFLWKHKNAETIIDGVLVLLLEKNTYMLEGRIVENLFPVNTDTNHIENYLKSRIQKYKSEKEHLNIIFKIIHLHFSQERLYFLEILLSQNVTYDIFTSLHFFGGSGLVISGSMIFYYGEKLKFWEATLSLLSGKTYYLKHRKWAKENITFWEKRISEEKESLFLRDF